MSLPSNLIYIDFETYYDTEYSLSRMTEKQYVTDARFKIHGAGVAIGDGPVAWLNGDECDRFFSEMDLSKWAVCGHNLNFDGMILTQHYGQNARLWVDTLGMARAVIGTRLRSLGLDSIGKAFGIGGKLDEGKALMSTRGLRDLTPQQLAALGQYCKDDIKLTRFIAEKLALLFPEGEYQVLDWTIRMAVNPRVIVNTAPLVQLEAEEHRLKADAIARAGVPKTELSSNPKFADLLRSLGVEPPTKTSKATGNTTFAFAKNDEAFADLLDHPDDKVHDVVVARLAVKSTIKESRAAKLRTLSANGPLPIILKYSGAKQTHRLSGGGGINVQNFTRKSLLRKALEAPPGFVFCVADLSQIELRGNCLASGQLDVLNELRTGGDPYLSFAKQIYDDPTLTKADNEDERKVGKVGELSLGYYSGAATFKAMLRAQAHIRIPMEEAIRIVKLYRKTHQMISSAWRVYGRWIEIMAYGEVPYMDAPINLPVTLTNYGFVLPSGLEVTYPGLTKYNFTTHEPVALNYAAGRDEQVGWAYINKQRGGGYAKLHAGVLNNNLIQSVCRDVNFSKTKQILDTLPDIDPEAQVVMSVHDETVVIARENKAQAVLDMMLGFMKIPPSWWPDLPVTAEGDIGKTYADAK